MVGISPTEMRLASSFVEEAIRSLATSHGTQPGAAWPGVQGGGAGKRKCLCWLRSGAELTAGGNEVIRGSPHSNSSV